MSIITGAAASALNTARRYAERGSAELHYLQKMITAGALGIEPPANLATVLREASLTGICFATLGWLQLGRVLTLPLGLLLAAGLVLVEFLIRLRERGRWEP